MAMNRVREIRNVFFMEASGKGLGKVLRGAAPAVSGWGC
jgi:hypothetical protein